MKRNIKLATIVLILSVLLTACTAPAQTLPQAEDTIQQTESVSTAKQSQEPEVEQIPVEASEPEKQAAPKRVEANIVELPESQETETEQEHTEPPKPLQEAFLVVLDPGHQAQGNGNLEPIGPGATEQKAKTASGTYGRTSGLAEYELNLQISLLLKEELEARGYQVLLTRETNDVDLSNKERAEIANRAEADACVRIHANGSESAAANGAMAICMTASSPYNAHLYKDSYALADAVLSGMVASTGAKREYIWETDTMSGINWSEVPVTILEVGYMTNPDEDVRLASSDYQKKIAVGVADGLDDFFSEKKPKEKQEQPLFRLESDIEQALSGVTSRWDVWAERLTDGAYVHCTRNVTDNKMVSASLIKLFIMGAVYDRVESGELALEDVESDLRSMIVISDNDAANALTMRLGDGDAAAGMQAINQWAAEIGCGDVQHNRLMLANNGLENYVSAESCAKILKMIYTGACVSKSASRQMLETLKQQQVNDRIPMGLPTGTVAAHKTGNLSGLCVADVGIVFGEKQDYILCVICNDPYTDSGATDKIVEITRLTAAFFAD